jgi:hypothetical protein
VSITARLKDPNSIDAAIQIVDFPEAIEGTQRFRWINLHIINNEHFTLPVGKQVADLIKEKLTIY